MSGPERSVRDATHADVPALIGIAAAGGSPDADERYLDFVASHGRLLVAQHEGDVVGFAGGVLIGDALMITDLFVDEAHRGRRLASHLAAEVATVSTRRITFSSQHPGALAVYRGLGMIEQWPLLTLRGRATGGAEPLGPSPWRHDRRELVEYFRSNGAIVAGDVIVQPATGDRPAVVLRMVADEPERRLVDTLAALPAGTEVELSVPEPHPLTAALNRLGFEVVDEDRCVATDGVHLNPQVAPLHRGLL